MAQSEVEQNPVEDSHQNDVQASRGIDNTRQTEEDAFAKEVGRLFLQPGDDNGDGDSPLYEVDPSMTPASKPGTLICRLCSFASPNPNTLKRHVCNHLKKQRLDREKRQMMILCLACGFENENNYVMAGHLRTHDKLVHSYMSLANKRSRFEGGPLLVPNYPCLLCDFIGLSAIEVVVHVKEFHQTEDFVCKICNMDCKTLNGFQEHKHEHELERSDTQVRPFLTTEGNGLCCPLCSFKSSSMKETVTHVETHDNVDVIACPSCYCRFHSTAALEEHAATHELGTACSKCSSVSINLSSFEGVVFCDSSVVPKRFHCTMCEFSTVRASSMTRHLQRHVLPTYQCSNCSFASQNKSTVQAHAVNCSRETEKPDVSYEWWCSDCSSVFSTGEELKNHARLVHQAVQNEEVVTCRQCGHQSSSVEEDRKHSEENHQKKKIRDIFKPYTPRGVFYCCMECDFQTKKVSSLKHHMTSHESLPRYLCGKCSRSFKTEEDYGVHELMMHRAGQALVCGDCGTAMTSTDLVEHYRIQHPSKVPPQVVEASSNDCEASEGEAMDGQVVFLES